LREYAVRRNLSAETKSVINFIDEIFKNNFIKSVKNGDTDIIDKVSGILKDNGTSTKRNTRSLLSKVAFLINPQKFSLYDSLAKESIWKIYKTRNLFNISDLDSYGGFLRQSRSLRDYLSEGNLFRNSLNLLSKFPETEAYKFFSRNNEAFEMRIVDKFLWLEAQKKSIKINNQVYIELIKLGL